MKEAGTVTIEEFHERTGEILDEVAAGRVTRAVTSGGRRIAVVVPVEDYDDWVHRRLLGRELREAEGEIESSGGLSSAEVLEELRRRRTARVG